MGLDQVLEKIREIKVFISKDAAKRDLDAIWPEIELNILKKKDWQACS